MTHAVELWYQFFGFMPDGTLAQGWYWNPHFRMGLICLAAFLIGAIPFGWIVARLSGVDITKVGSGNIGMTNVWRVLGWKAGLAVLVLDVAKGFIPTLLIGGVAREAAGCLSPFGSMPAIYVGISAVLGHTFSPFMRFKGGKGVATGLGVTIALFQLWILIPLGAFLISLLISRMVSLSSIVGASALAVTSFLVYARLEPSFTSYAPPLEFIAIPLFLLVLYTHRSNIKRILDGTENKVSFGRKP